jgi:hypothetical protein
LKPRLGGLFSLGISLSPLTFDIVLIVCVKTHDSDDQHLVSFPSSFNLVPFSSLPSAVLSLQQLISFPAAHVIPTNISFPTQMRGNHRGWGERESWNFQG